MLKELLYQAVINGKTADDLKKNILVLAGHNKEELIKQVAHMVGNGCLAQEMEILTDILLYLIEDENPKIRHYIIQMALELEVLPDEIINKIAHTYPIEVIAEFLSAHRGFTERGLLSFCQKNNDIEKLVMVALRPDLDHNLIDNLLDKKELKIVISLLDNKSIHLQLNHYETIIRHFQEYPRVVSALARREDITDQLVDQFIEFFTPSNREKFLNNYVHRPALNQSETFWNKLNFYLTYQDELNAFRKVDLLYARNQLLAFVVLRFLYMGDLLSFMYSLAKLSDIPFSYLKLAFNNGYDEKFFCNVYKKAAMPANMEALTSRIMSIIIAKLAEGVINKENYRSVISEELRKDRGNVKIHKAQYMIELLENC
jgi:hypothetical protein